MERVINGARDRALAARHSIVTADHLLRTLLEEEDVVAFLKQIEFDVEETSNDLDEVLSDTDIHGSARQAVNPAISRALTEIMQTAVGYGTTSHNSTVTPLHLLQAMTDVPEANADAHAFVILRHGKVTSTKIKDFQMETGLDGEGTDSVKDLEGAVSFLKKFTKNLNEEAANARIDPLIGRRTEVADIILKVARRSKNNVIVIGDPGVGKTAVIEGLAKMIIEKKVPKTIEDSTIYSLSVTDLIAGTKYRGEAEQRVRDLLAALSMVPNPILFIDEIHMMMGAGAGSSGSMDMANMLKPALARGRLRCIGATTHDEFQQHIEKDRALMRRFQTMQVEEPTLDDCKAILAGVSTLYSEYHGITYTKEAIDAAVDLSARYIQNRHLPDKAIDVLDAAGARQRIRGEDRDTEITIKHIRDEVSIIAKVPVTDVSTDDLSSVRNLKKALDENVFGQESAVEQLVDTMMVAKTGLRSRKKTLGTFLLTGGTGTGKSELSKQLAASLQMKLTRFDMSEYRESHSISKLIGSPPGYVGYGAGGAGSGLLTGEVEKYPHSVVLFDEIEKAHPDIFNLFLQIMDEGVLTNSAGKKVSFENTVVLMTSNVGAREAATRAVGFTKETHRDGADDAVVNRTFSPEFRNRLDAILKFKSLTTEAMLRVVDKFIKETAERVSEQGFTLTVTAAARSQLAKDGYDPAMGARPLLRLVTDQVKKPISRKIVFDGMQPGALIIVDLDDDSKFLITVGDPSANKAVEEKAEEA